MTPCPSPSWTERALGARPLARPTRPWALLWALLWALMLLAASAQPSQAQPAEDDPLVLEEQRARQARSGPVEASSVEPVTLRVHWRLWKRVVEEGKSGKSELEALRHDMVSLGVRNDLGKTLAAIAWVEAKHASGQLPPAQAIEAWDALMALSPELPHVPLARARFLLRHAPSQIGAILTSVSQGATRALAWPATALPMRLNLVVYSLLATLLAGTLFLLAQLLRYFSVLAHDVSRVLPRGFSTNQSMIALLAVILVPGLLLRSALLSAVLTLALLGAVQQWRERLVTLLLLGALAALPWLDGQLGHELGFPSSDSATLLVAQYMECEDGCARSVEAALEAAGPKADPLLRYTWMVMRYRQGQTQQVSDAISQEQLEAWPWPLRGLGLNLWGAALVAQTRHAQAKPALDKALAAMPTSAAPAANLMRSAQLQDDNAASLEALKQANARQLVQTLEFLRYKQRDVNSFLWIEPAPLPLFYARYEALERPSQAPGVVARFWPFVAGQRLPLAWALWLGLGAALLVALTTPLSLCGATSTPCPRCGLARDPEDGARSGDHPYCEACYTTFVLGATLEYQARQQSEDRIQQRAALQRTARRLLGAVAPGAGHMSAGYGVRGFAMTFALVLVLLWWLRPEGLWRGPHQLLSRDWYGLGVASGVLGVSVALTAWLAVWRDLQPASVITRQHRPKIDAEATSKEAPR